MKNVEEREKVQMKNWNNVVLVPEFDEQGRSEEHTSELQSR